VVVGDNLVRSRLLVAVVEGEILPLDHTRLDEALLHNGTVISAIHDSILNAILGQELETSYQRSVIQHH